MEKKIFRFPRGRELTSEDLAKFIRKNDELVSRKYKPLRDAYEGKYKIFRQPKKPAWKPDNRLAVNFASYIVDTFSGYVQGVPQQITSKDSKTAERVTDYNDSAGTIEQLAAAVDSMLIYGRSYLMAYEDEAGDIGIAATDPEESFIIYDDGIRQRPLYFVRTYYDIDRKRHGSVSDGEGTIRYFDWAGAIEWTAEERHGFDGVPAVELSTGIIRKGIFADVLNLIDAFNQLLSDKANDISMFADAYLKILGADIDDKSLKWIRNNRVINLKGRNASDLVVEFLERPNADGSQENLLNRLYELIFVTAMVVNISDADFTAASGQAMKYRLQPMTNLAGKINRRLTKSIKQLYRLICSNPAGDLEADDWQKIDVKYTLNLPANLLDEAQTAGAMSGITSRRTQLQVMSVVSDVDAELAQIEKESDVTAYTTDYETARGGGSGEGGEG